MRTGFNSQFYCRSSVLPNCSTIVYLPLHPVTRGAKIYNGNLSFLYVMLCQSWHPASVGWKDLWTFPDTGLLPARDQVGRGCV